MSGHSKGRLLGLDSGAGSQEPQQGGQGKALSNKDTVPWHLNKKESNQSQLMYQWLPDGAVIKGQIWGQARKMGQQGRAKEIMITRQCCTDQSKVVVNEAGAILAAPNVVPAQAEKPLGEQGMHSGPWHNTTFQLLIELSPASVFHPWWWFCRHLKSRCQNCYKKKAKTTEITVMANINCFTDLTAFGITRNTSVGTTLWLSILIENHTLKKMCTVPSLNYHWVWCIHCIYSNDSTKNAHLKSGIWSACGL